jgi:predicted MFS family arabinose efflux permease
MERAGGGCAMVLSAPMARRPRLAGGEQAGEDIEACVPGTRATPSTIALIAILSAQLMVVLDFSIVNVALPSIQRDLAFSASGLEWVVTAYAITLSGLLILGGRIGDVFGRRRLFLLGLTVFSIASLAGGFAGSGAELVAARAAQGVGAALVAPTALALVSTRNASAIVPPAVRSDDGVRRPPGWR